MISNEWLPYQFCLEVMLIYILPSRTRYHFGRLIGSKLSMMLPCIVTSRRTPRKLVFLPVDARAGTQEIDTDEGIEATFDDARVRGQR